MVKPEFTHRRWAEKTYSLWHRTFADYCYGMDIDFIEWRDGRGIIAISETKKNPFRSDWQDDLLLEMGKKLKVPVYRVIFREEDCERQKHIINGKEEEIQVPLKLLIFNLSTGERKIMNSQEYQKFIENL